ncbi:MAG: TonB-dependent receptor [Gammaproteobacteria bacterium]
MDFSKISYGFISCLFVAVLSLNTIIVSAQDSDSRLEEIVVTAQKKEQGLAEVPISIQVLSGDKIDNLGITSLEDLQTHVPGLMINKGAAQFNIYIRGVGSGTNKGFSQSVTQFLDNMPIARGEQYLSALLDVERIEVLKGTQGVLFGKNTIGGVVNMVSKSPEIGGDADGHWSIETVPEWNTIKVQAASSFPVSDTFAMRLAATVEESDGWTYNDLLKEDGPSSESHALRATFLWQLDNTEINLKAYTSTHEKSGQHGGTDIYRTPAPLGAMLQYGYTGTFIAQRVMAATYPNQSIGQPGITSLDYTSAGLPTGGTVDSDNVILNISSTWGDYDVKSTTSVSSYDYGWGLDADFGPLNFLATDNFNEFEMITQEFVISSPSSDSFEFIAGVYYEEIEMDVLNNGLFDLTLGGQFGKVFPLPDIAAFQTRNNPPFARLSTEFTATHTIFDETSSSISAFFEGTWYLSDQLTLIAGIRVSEDEKDVKASQVNSASATGGIGINTPTLNPIVAGLHDILLGRLPYDFPKQSRSQSHTTPSLKMTYELSDSTRLYASYAEGYKAGGYDGSENAGRTDAVTPSPAFAYKPEEAETIELGVKMLLPDQNLRLNAAYFSTDYRDMQVSAFNGATFVVSNAAEAEITGFEFDATWAPTDNVLIGGSLTTLDFAYGAFTASCTGDQDVAYRAARPETWPTANRALRQCTQDLKGKAGNFAPETSAHVYANYFSSTNGGNELVYTIAANHVSEFNSSGVADPLSEHDAATKIDLNVVLRMDNGLEIKVFGKNVTDEIVGSSSLALPVNPGSFFKLWEPGKQFGISIRKRF